MTYAEQTAMPPKVGTPRSTLTPVPARSVKETEDVKAVMSFAT